MERQACVGTGDRLPRGHHLAFGNLIINEDSSARKSKINNDVVEGVPPSSNAG